MINSVDKKIIRRLQEEIPITATPYKDMAIELNIDEDELIDKIKKYNRNGVLKRVAGILYHRKAGFKANAMVVWNVKKKDIDSIAKYMIGIREISHCYEREKCLSWNYNLYTMIHSKNKETCMKIIQDISDSLGLIDYKVLFSTKELKKTSMKYFSDKMEYDEGEI